MAEKKEKNLETAESAIVSEKKSDKSAKAANMTKKESDKIAKAAAKKKKEPLTKRIAKKWKEFVAEFKKIVWYSRKDTWNSTILVIICIVVVGAVVAALDYAFSTGLTFLGSLF